MLEMIVGRVPDTQTGVNYVIIGGPFVNFEYMHGTEWDDRYWTDNDDWVLLCDVNSASAGGEPTSVAGEY